MIKELYHEAIRFIREKHIEQKVPGTNSNYFLHILNVSNELLMAYNFDKKFDINFAIQIAILHDTIYGPSIYIKREK
jgi:guanosine-3',5'-bis(diphosphate) 3'-pyrophosphohydrolase